MRREEKFMSLLMVPVSQCWVLVSPFFPLFILSHKMQIHILMNSTVHVPLIHISSHPIKYYYPFYNSQEVSGNAVVCSKQVVRCHSVFLWCFCCLLGNSTTQSNHLNYPAVSHIDKPQWCTILAWLPPIKKLIMVNIVSPLMISF